MSEGSGCPHSSNQECGTCKNYHTVGMAFLDLFFIDLKIPYQQSDFRSGVANTAHKVFLIFLLTI